MIREARENAPRGDITPREPDVAAEIEHLGRSHVRSDEDEFAVWVDDLVASEREDERKRGAARVLPLTDAAMSEIFDEVRRLGGAQ